MEAFLHHRLNDRRFASSRVVDVEANTAVTPWFATSGVSHASQGGCWNGYHRVKGKEAYTPGSCEKNGGGGGNGETKKKKEKNSSKDQNRSSSSKKGESESSSSSDEEKKQKTTETTMEACKKKGE